MQITLHRGGVLLVIDETKLHDLIVPFLLAPLVASPLAKQMGHLLVPQRKLECLGNPGYACKSHPSHFAKLHLLLPMLETTL